MAYEEETSMVDYSDQSDLERKAREKKSQLIAELKAEYRTKLASGELTVEELTAELAESRGQAVDIEEGREPFTEGPFIMKTVLRELLAETDSAGSDAEH